eukprot:883905-Pleurochrysis_carterae.AAC.1
MLRLRPIVTGGTTCGRQQYGATLRPWRVESLRVSAVRASRLRIRDRLLTRQHTKETAANDLQAENKLREISSLHTKDDVN